MQVPAPIDYLSLNSELNIYGPDGRIQFAKDREAVRGYFLEHVNPNTVFFHNLEEKLEYLVANGYYEAAFLAQYRPAFVKELFKAIYARRYRFTTFVGAYKFFTGYALKTFDGSRYLERYEDRIVVCALYLARGSEKQARLLAEEMIAQRFQPATPTFLNSGKAQRGELVSCFPAGTPVETTEGPKAIELIRVGDTVITHDGSAKAVTDVMERANEEGLVALSISGVSDVYYSTPEHPVLVHRPGAQHDLRPCLVGDGDQTDVWWVRAGDVQEGDLLAIDPRRIGEATAEEDVAALAVPSNVATLERPSRSKAARAAAGAQATEVLRVIAGHLMAPVTKARRTPRAPITVYNLEVEDNHTYLARGVVVHNCFLIQIEDSMNSIGRAVNSALQLSKRGGGVAFSLSNLRGAGDPIKNIEDQSSGVLPVMKLLEDCFSYADQLGARQGAGAVYLHAHHWDIETFLDCRREAADEKIRIKTLSLGVVVPDITFELARGDEDMYLFSPYDVARKYGKPFSDVVISDVYRELVDDPGVRKRKIKARAFFQLLAEVQFESGYPYLLFEDNANRASAVPGRIVMSNLCVTGETELLTDKGPRRAKDLHESGEDLRVMVDRRTIGTREASLRGLEEYPAIPMALTARQAEVFKVSTVEGFELRATAWHKMFIERDGEVLEVRLAELMPGDHLLVQSGEGRFGDHHDPDLAYLAGWLAGDGTFGELRSGADTARWDLYGDKDQFVPDLELAAVNSLAQHHDGDVHHSSTLTPAFRGEYAGRRSLSSAPLTRVLERHGMTRESKLRVPQFVSEGSRETVCAYLSGVYQADGSVCGDAKAKTCSIQLGSVDRGFLVEVQRLLLNLGMFSRIYATRKAGTSLLPDGRGGQREYPTQQLYTLRISDAVGRERFMDTVALSPEAQVKFERLNAPFQKPYYQAPHRFRARVASVAPDGIEDVYDTTVDEAHSLIFNGLVTGNCSEILQPQEASEIDDEQAFVEVGKDVSCNLGSLNISQVMAGPDIRRTIDAAIRALSAVSDMSDISCVPTIQAGNRRSHAVGLGQMNLHGYLASQEIHYDSPEAVDFVDAYFRTVAYHALWTSSVIARETGESFDGFTESGYHSGAFFERYAKAWRPRTAKVRRIMRDAGIELPSVEDWARLARHVRRHGMYNQNLQAVAPTGSISYVNHATASIHPITSMIEMRKEGKMGRVYYPAAHLDDENAEYFKDAYEIGPYALIDVYAAAAQHVDQGLSCTLFFTEEASTRDINRAQIYAWRKGLKTLYYVRVRSAVLEGTDTEGCVSCAV
nr:LAGLIDADG family homing endonuclease [Miltoncostaea oceani]